MSDLEHHYDKAFATIGFGKFHCILLLSVGSLTMFVMDETMGMGLNMVAATCDLEVDSQRKSIATSASFAGIVLTAYFWGYACDIHGRRLILMITSFFSLVLSVVSVFMPDFWSFVILRLVLGMFLAGPSTVCQTYLGEFCTNTNRPAVMNFMGMFVGLGMMYCPALGIVILIDNRWRLPISEGLDFTPWRLQLVMYSFPGIIGAFLLIILPESPKYLLLVAKQVEKAHDVVDKICMQNLRKPLSEVQSNDDFKSMTRRKSQLPQHLEMFSFKNMWSDTKPIFQKPLVFDFSICCVIMFGLCFVANGLGLWYPTIRGRMYSDETINTTCVVIANTKQASEELLFFENLQVCVANLQIRGMRDGISMGQFFVLGYLLKSLLLMTWGRRPTLLFALLVSCLSCFSLFFVVGDFWSMVFLTMTIVPASTSVSVMSSVVVDLMPTEYRGKAVCICLTMGRLGAVIGTNILGLFLNDYCILTFSVFFVVLLAFGLLSYFSIPTDVLDDY